MKRNVYYVGLGVIFVIILAVTVWLFPASTPTAAPDKNSQTSKKVEQAAPQAPQEANDTKPTESPAKTAKTAGVYTEYNEKAFTDAANKTRILFFHAPWCPQCRQLDKDIYKQQLPDNTVIFKVDYDTNQPLRQKYGVTLQTTFVRVNEKAEKVKSIVAYNNPIYATVKSELGL